MARRKKTAQQEENVSLGPQVPEGEEVFGVCHIFASFNDTFVHVTDLSGRWVNRGVATVVALPSHTWKYCMCMFEGPGPTSFASVGRYNSCFKLWCFLPRTINVSR